MSDIELKNYTHNKKCSSCGNCCTEFIPMTKLEVKRIKQYLKEHPDIKEQLHIEGNVMHLLCAFRDEVNKCCLIYPVRPLICRKFLCSKSKDTICKNRNNIQAKAYFNRIDPKTMQIDNMISSHALFFGNTYWETACLYSICDYDKVKLKKLNRFLFNKY